MSEAQPSAGLSVKHRLGAWFGAGPRGHRSGGKSLQGAPMVKCVRRSYGRPR